MPITPDKARLIAEEKSKITVDSYQDLAFEGAWKGRSRALWAVAALGVITGIVMGLAAPLVAMAAGATITAAAVGQSVAIFAALGMFAGFATGATLGNVSGASAAVAKESDARSKSLLIENTISNMPSIGLDHSLPKVVAPEPKKTFGETLKSYVNVKTMATFAVLGLVGGLIMAGGFIAAGGLVAGTGAEAFALPAMKTLLGAAASSAPAVTTYFAGVMASFGAIFGINYPKIATKMTHVAGDMLGDVQTPQVEATKVAPTVTITQEQSVSRAEDMERNIASSRASHAATMSRSNSYQDMAAARSAATLQRH